jgi:hypothetical protein
MTMTASQSTAQDYALPNDWQHASERLALLEACHDPATFRRAQALGVDAGWSCLEAGAGHGSVARWLAQRWGPAGASSSTPAARCSRIARAGSTAPPRSSVGAGGRPGGTGAGPTPRDE